ncbi:hypothetical protein CHS0354_035902 [Potamilus streckersoni]|uniref:Uncharacterized protein n=1 Tax=Potamilus streckersoni TaxID=2493646 RepID=A0AAE0T5P6_9BIVA|nr:hypothetical protein CHS0354_035902 [Potamilus streckersoni]
MASRNATIEDLKEQFLICSVCKYLYDNDTREPRLLPCLHTYCTLCVQEMIKDKSVSCPQCRELHQVQDDDVNTFKKDINRRELIDFVTVRSKVPDLLCNMCEENKEGNKAVTRCLECAQFLCKNCVKSHRGGKFTKDHKVVNLDQLQESDLDDFTHILFCSVIGHEHNKLSLYCEKCETVVCIHCTATTHKAADGHIIRNVDDASDEGMENVRLHLQEAEELRMRTKSVIENVERRLDYLAKVQNDLNTTIEAMFKNCIEMLNRREAEVKNKLSIICYKKEKVLEQQLVNAKHHQQNILDCIHFSTQTLQHKNSANFLQIRKIITDRFDKLLKEPLDNLPREDVQINLKDNSLVEFQNHVLTLGKICSTSVYPPKTEVKIFDLVDTGRQTVLKLQLYDYQGNPQAAVGVPLQIDIKDLDYMNVQPEVNYEENGQITVTCDVRKQGWYTARVCVLETEVWIGKFKQRTGNETIVPPHGTKANIDLLSLEEVRKIYLQCPSCHEQFDIKADGDHPVLLPCLHSLGKKCAIKLWQNFKLQCPICKIVHQMPNIDVMPIDPTKEVLKEYLAIRADWIPCSSGCERQSHFRCMECTVFLCEACYTNHRQNVMFRDHMISLLKEICDSETLIDINRISMCTVRGHERNELIAFCETCDMLVCNTCALSKQHKSENHNIEIDLVKIYNDKKAAVVTVIEQLQAKNDDVACVIRDVEREKVEAKSHLEKVLNEVNEIFCRCEKALKSRRECLNNQALKFTKGLIENLDIQLERLRTYEQYIENTRNLTTEKLNFCGNVSFIRVEKVLSQRIKKLINQPHDTHPCHTASFRFLKDNIEEATSRTFPNLGFLWISDVCPWKTEVELYSEVYIGEDTRVLSLRFATFDGSASVPLFQDGMVKAKIIDPDGKALHVNLVARKESYIVLDVHINPEKVGKHEFHIEVLEKNFKAGKGFFVVKARAATTLPAPIQSIPSSSVLTMKIGTVVTTTATSILTISASAKASTETIGSEISKAAKAGTMTTSFHSDTTSTAVREVTAISAPYQSNPPSSVLLMKTGTMATVAASNVEISTSAKVTTEPTGSAISKATNVEIITTSRPSDKGTTSTDAGATTTVTDPHESKSAATSNVTISASAKATTEPAGSERSKATKVGTLITTRRSNTETTSTAAMSFERKNYILVVAIVIGKTFSTYAFQFNHNFEKSPTKISVPQAWNDGQRTLLSCKTLTCLLLDKDRKIHSFGFEAEKKYAKLCAERANREWYFFRRLKMKLEDGECLKIELADETGKKMLALQVFSLYIQCLMKDLTKRIDEQAMLCKINEIHWILTVPAIWNDSSKHFMRKAAEQAGIPSGKLDVAMEPEAASLYCQYLPINKFCTQTEQVHFGASPTGTKYMILDVGGSTTDISVHEKLEDGKVKNIAKASRCKWGGSAVDGAFLKLIVDLVGKPVMTAFQKDYHYDYLDFVKDFETAKRNMPATTTDWLRIKLPVQLLDLCKDMTGYTFKKCVDKSDYRNRIKLVNDRMRLDAELVRDMFRQVTEKIVNFVEEALKKTTGISIILMVGGFSESGYVQEVIRCKFQDKFGLSVVIPLDAGLSTLYGAVLFGWKT